MTIRKIAGLPNSQLFKNKILFKKYYTWAQAWDRIKQRFYKTENCHMKWGPTWLTFLVTSRCVLKCNFCYFKGPRRQLQSIEFDDISFNNYTRMFNKFRQAQGICLAGGEPFLHKEIFDMLEHSHRNNMRVMIPTCGVVLNGMIERIVTSPLNLLNISLDAYDSNEYWRMRGGSKKIFNTVIENIKEIVEKRNRCGSKLALRVSFICTKENYRSIPDKIRLTEELGVDIVYFDNLVPSNLPSFTEDQCLYEDDYDALEVIKNIAIPKPRLKIFTPTIFRKNSFNRECRMPFENLTIDAEGNISTCCVLSPRREYGNVLHDREVWNNASYSNMRKLMMDDSLPLPSHCKTCPGLGHNRTVISRDQGRVIYKEIY